MKKINFMICGISGIVLLVLFLSGFWLLAKFVPPISPSASAEEVAKIFSENRMGILIGMAVYMMGTLFNFPFSGGVAALLKANEGSDGGLPFWTYTFLLTNAVNIIILLLPCILWVVAAYRPDRNPELVYLINDFNWMILVFPLSAILVQYFCVGIVVLTSKGSSPAYVVPRWIGYLNLWFVFLALPAVLLPFFKSGPFAWNGLLTFWLALPCFGSWVLIMSIQLLKSAKKI